jgi:hypothetical protein
MSTNRFSVTKICHIIQVIFWALKIFQICVGFLYRNQYIYLIYGLFNESVSSSDYNYSAEFVERVENHGLGREWSEAFVTCYPIIRLK